MKRLLINNPLGPLPNMRLRYLSPEVVEAYERALIEASVGDLGRPLPHIGSLTVWLQRNRSPTRRPAHVDQVGLVDRFADPPYRNRWLALDEATRETSKSDMEDGWQPT
jgi:hypothetical protein